MTGRSVRIPVATAAAGGAVLWVAAALVSGKREAWDGAVYWVLAYPAALLLCAWLGHAFPERSWRWPLVLFEAQFVAMGLRNGELAGLWPLGMILFAVLALPGMLAARFGARLAGGSSTRVR